MLFRSAGFFGSQAIVVAVDAKAVNPENTRWEIFTHGGRNPTGLDAVEWALEMQRRGAGENPAHQYGQGRYEAGL